MQIPATQINAAQAVATDGWTDASEGWTYASAATFTVAGDVTAKYSKGTRLRFTQTTVKYGVVAGSSFGAGVTTVTIAVNTDFVLANAAISANYYSYQANPQGYPGWFTYAPSFVGFSVDPTVNEAKFAIVGNTCFVIISAWPGTSNSTTFSFTIPVDCANVGGVIWTPVRTLTTGSVFDGNLGTVSDDVSANTWSVYRPAVAAWVNSGSKGFYGEFFYRL